MLGTEVVFIYCCKGRAAAADIKAEEDDDDCCSLELLPPALLAIKKAIKAFSDIGSVEALCIPSPPLFLSMRSDFLF